MKLCGCLERYNYNCIKIMDIEKNVLCLNSITLDGLPKAHNVSDSTLDKVIQLDENQILQRCAKEIKAVNQAVILLNDEIIKEIFEEYKRKGKQGYNKWDIIDKLNISESTHKRRKKKLIYTINNELKNL